MSPGDRDPRHRLGARGEDLVAAWYADRGATVVDRNWRVRAGELDLVVDVGGVLVFCEVKTRSGTGFGSPFEAVTAVKQRRLRALGAQWLAAHPGRWRGVRFDVAAVLWPRGARPVVEVVEGAF